MHKYIFLFCFIFFSNNSLASSIWESSLVQATIMTGGAIIETAYVNKFLILETLAEKTIFTYIPPIHNILNNPLIKPITSTALYYLDEQLYPKKLGQGVPKSDSNKTSECNNFNSRDPRFISLYSKISINLGLHVFQALCRVNEDKVENLTSILHISSNNTSAFFNTPKFFIYNFGKLMFIPEILTYCTELLHRIKKSQ